MNRLTHHNYFDDTLYFDTQKQFAEYNLNLYKKVKIYEDIEEELGIDLITLFKALKQGYIYVLLNNHIFKIQIMGINYNTGYLLLYDEDNHCSFENYEINAYGKTWALTKEELQNE